MPSAFHLRTSWSDSGLAFDLQPVARVSSAALVGGHGSAEVSRNLMLMQDTSAFDAMREAMREEEAKANRLTELRRADEDKARRQAERDAKEAAEQAKRMEEREAALEEYRAQREKDLNTLTTNVNLSFEDQQAFFDKGRRGAGSAARTAKDQSETQFQEDHKKGSHIAFTSQDVGKRIIIEDDGKVVCGGLVRAVEWELGTRPPTMVGIIADVSRLPASRLPSASCQAPACL